MHTQILTMNDQKDMNFAMRLSFSIGVLMLFIKTYAYYITGSTAILSDASESVIHVFAVGFSTYSMWLSHKPADDNHPYGHEKISYFSAGFEGSMIIIAAAFILYEAIHKIIYGVESENIDSGMLFIVAATLINLVLGCYLTFKGKKYRSIILEANGKHILTDCWTSIAVLAALVLVKFTEISLFDPIVACLAAFNILWTGSKLLRRCVSGLMDQADPIIHRQIVCILDREASERNVEYHRLRDRLSGHKIFIEFHLLLPADISLSEAHEIATQIEVNIKNALDIQSEVLSHIEPRESHDLIHNKYGLTS